MVRRYPSRPVPTTSDRQLRKDESVGLITAAAWCVAFWLGIANAIIS
jgi:hypothetical protein